MTARSTVCCNSRTLPGQAYFNNLFFVLPGQPAHLFLIFAGIPLQEILCQQEDVVSAFPQRWNMQLDGVDAIQQVLAEVSFVHQPTDVCIGGADEPHINGRSAYFPND